MLFRTTLNVPPAFLFRLTSLPKRANQIDYFKLLKHMCMHMAWLAEMHLSTWRDWAYPVKTCPIKKFLSFPNWHRLVQVICSWNDFPNFLQNKGYNCTSHLQYLPVKFILLFCCMVLCLSLQEGKINWCAADFFSCLSREQKQWFCVQYLIRMHLPCLAVNQVPL